jgi:uncharacterized membrane protein YbhN (UPF0104 family)
VNDLHEFFNAAQAFFNRLGDVRTGPLAIAFVFHTANLLLRTRAWYAIIRAAYPEQRRYRWRSCAGAYLSGVGLNSLIPARGGDLLKLYLVRLRLPESRVATVVATLLVETLLDTIIGPVLFAYAYYEGVVPRIPDLPHLPAFEWSAAVSHPRAAGIFVAVVVLLGLLLLRHATRVARDFRERVRQGFTILRQPRRYLVQTAFPQAVGWVCRVGTMFYMLRAFSIHADIRNALLVLVVGSISTLLPLTPGGVGTQQALIVVVLSGQAPDSTLLSFSVGMQVFITVANALLGFAALTLMLRSLSLRKAIRDARAHHASEGGAGEAS